MIKLHFCCSITAAGANGDDNDNAGDDAGADADADADVADDGLPAFAALSNTSKISINHRQLTPVATATETATATATPHSFTYAANFGLVGDGHIDDTEALQRSIDEAASSKYPSYNKDNTFGGGGTVILPKGVFLTTSPLIIPAGITVTGQGYGPSPLALSFRAGGSVIAYCGTDYAVKIEGHAASLNNVAVYDWRGPEGGVCDSMKAKGGVLLNGDGKLIESVTMSNVLIYWFMGGTSLTLRARNHGGVAYNNFQNIRVRHAHRGISLEAEAGSFVNSNSFLAGAVTGGITEVGLFATGPGACNDNKFMGMAIEPPHTTLAHVYVTGSKTNVRLLDVRLEGTEMTGSQPLVIIEDSSYGNVMTGMLGHTHVQADLNRNPGLDLLSAKSVGLDPVPLNHYWNAAFKGLNTVDNTIPGWNIPSNGLVTIVPDEEEAALYADHHVLSIQYLGGGGTFKLQADALPKSPGHSMATFGIYAKSTVPNSICAAMRYDSGSIISSAHHSGSGDWEFIGMSAKYDPNAPYFYFSITGNVLVTAPTFVYGGTPATPGASLISSSGARMSGTLSLGVATAFAPVDNGDRWVLPRNQGNIFLMDMNGGDPSRAIRRINYRAADRFPRGTAVTLIFEEPGTIVFDQAYIKLANNQKFISTEHSSLTLLGLGSSSWIEVSRNN
mmetsp:Transcript_35839/g.39910  ORF Transcript_35839/g.39910 Transcript_35839/m.39910 type:complete len:672 (-) Transcript_35839:102-2117(-)